MRLKLCAVVPLHTRLAVTRAPQISPVHGPTPPEAKQCHLPITVKFDHACDVRTFASKLILLTNNHINAAALDRITLRVTQPDGQQWIADPLNQLADAGIVDGVCVEAVAQGRYGNLPHRTAPLAMLRIISDQSAAAVISLVPGPNTVGRDRSNRVVIGDARVSRVHATIMCHRDYVIVHDHRSHNHTTFIDAAGQATLISRKSHELQLPTRISFGGVHAEIIPATVTPFTPAPLPLTTHSPRNSRIADAPREPPQILIPEVASDLPPQRFPIVSAIAPAAVGTALFVATQSLISLVGIAVSPIIIVATWCENRWSRRRALRRNREEYRLALAEVTGQIDRLHDTERTHREQQLPSTQTCIQLFSLIPVVRNENVNPQTPAPTHTMQVRCGTGTVASRLTAVLPNRTAVTNPLWEQVLSVHTHAQRLVHSPVEVDLGGEILVLTGPPSRTEDTVRSFIVQLLARFRANELCIGVISTLRTAPQTWSWVAWLPHSTPQQLPLAAPLLAHTEDDINMLLHCIETLVVGLPSQTESTRVLLVVDGAPPWVIDRVIRFSALTHNTRFTVLIRESAVSPEHYEHTQTIDTENHPSVDVWEHCTIAEAQQFARQYVHEFAVRLHHKKYPIKVLPDTVALSTVPPFDTLRSLAHQEDQWAATHSLIDRWQANSPHTVHTLTAVLGISTHGPVALNLRADGPHALVAGTTGAGKSGLLQSWILSLAASYSPDRLTLLLIDFKGGAAFADCAKLPHVVGFISDLTPQLIERALRSLTAEIRTREQCLSRLGAPDVETLEQRSDQSAPPSLVVFIDECGVLLREYPPFRETLNDLAQRGRSLGIHLVLATQRPTGVISEQLAANIAIRIALRVANTTESREVLGSPDAAYLSPRTPGRCFLTTGADTPRLFQSCHAAGHRTTSSQHDPEIEPFCFSPSLSHDIKPAVTTNTTAQTTSTLKQFVDYIQQTAALLQLRKPREICFPPLPHILRRDSLDDGTTVAHGTVIMGLLDEPATQRQAKYAIPIHLLGHVLSTGASRTGKTNTLCSIALELTRTCPATWIYHCVPGIDDAYSPSLPSRLLKHCPGFSATIPFGNIERFTRAMSCFEHVLKLTPPAYYRPHVVILIDDIAALRETLRSARDGPTLIRRVTDFLQHSTAFGITVLASAKRISTVPGEWLDLFTRQIHHRPCDRTEAHLSGLDAQHCSADTLPPGRAIICDIQESRSSIIQIPLVEIPTAPVPTRTAWPDPPPIPVLPRRFSRDHWSSVAPAQGWCALDLERFTPVAAPTHGLCVVTGRPGSGRSSALCTLVASIQERARTKNLNVFLMLVGASGSQLHRSFCWARCTTDVAEAHETLTQLAPGERVAVVIESSMFDSVGVGPAAQPSAGPTNHPLHALLQYRSEQVLMLCEASHRLPQSAWAVRSALQQSDWTVVLQPDSSDPPDAVISTLATPHGAEFTPGRGIVTVAGKHTRVQFALPSGSERCADPPVSAVQ